MVKVINQSTVHMTWPKKKVASE